MKRVLAAFIFAAFCSSAVVSASAAELAEIKANQIWNQGLAAYNNGKYDDAIYWLSQRAKLAPADANAYYYLGNCYLKKQKHDEASRMFSACIRLAPASQAGQYSLQALEKMSSMPKAAATPEEPPKPAGPDPKQVEAIKESLVSERALDKDYNDAVARIKTERRNLQQRVDRVFEDLQEKLSGMNRRSTPNFAAELAKAKSEAEMKVEQLQMKELRLENRLLAPDKIDVRAVPEVPQKKDDSKTALGALADYYKPEKPFDPMASDITPEIGAKFMTVRDVFGDLSTYQTQARKLAKQMFQQLKSGVEMKQDRFDMDVDRQKDQLIRDVYNIHANYGNANVMKYLDPLQTLNSTKIPRNDQNNMTQMDIEVSQATERAKKRIKELQENYNKDVDILIAGTKERLASLIGGSITIGSQLKKPHGTIQVIPIGTSVHTRNYVNFGERTEPQPHPSK